MPDEEKTFEVKIEGTGATPQTIRLRDLYEVLHSLEAAVSATASRYTTKQPADFHLTKITGGSTGCHIALDPQAHSAAAICMRAIAARDLSPLPSQARESLISLRTKLRSHDWTVRVEGSNGIPTAAIAPDTEFKTDTVVRGRSTLSARVVRVGGLPRPTAHLVFPDNSRLIASVANESLAMRLGELLYRTVSVDGDAFWTGSDWKLTDFRITSIGTYDQDAGLLETLRKLSDIAGDFWDELDPDEYIASLRADD